MKEFTKIEVENGKFILTLPTGETRNFDSLKEAYLYLLTE